MKLSQIRISQLNELEKDLGENGRFAYMLIKASTVKSLISSSRFEIAQRDIYQDAIQAISKICKSRKHKDPISDILCECNRASRLIEEQMRKL